MADRYISRAALVKLLDDYRNIGLWNTTVYDPDTIRAVLTVITNELGHMETVSPRQLSNKLLKAQNAAIAFYVEHARKDIARYRDDELAAEARNSLLAPFWRGMQTKTEEYLSILERLLGGDVDA